MKSSASSNFAPNQNLSANGRNWCTSALDPFHDFPVPIQGMPDSCTQPSYTRVMTQSIMLTVPGGESAPQDNIRLVFSGLHESTDLHRKMVMGVNSPVGYVTEAEFIPNVGPIYAISSTNPDFCDLSHVVSAPTTCSLLSSVPLTPDLTTPSRIIGLGIEVHDVTAPLYRQGSVCCIRVPGALQPMAHSISTTSPVLGTVHYLGVQTPTIPCTRASMALCPGFVEWEMSKGIYSVARLIAPQSPRSFYCYNSSSGIVPSSNTTSFLMEENPDTFGEEKFGIPCNWGHTSSVAIIEQYLTPSYDSGFQPIVIMMSGLHHTSALRVNIRTIVEYFPEITDRAVIGNAIVSSPYDPTAMMEYFLAASVLPAGVPVGMNAKGDWWRMVQSALRVGARMLTVAVPAGLAAFGQPGLAGIASTIGAEVMRRLNKAPQLPPRPKKDGGKKPKNRNGKSN